MHHDIAGSTLVIFEDLGDMPQEQDSHSHGEMVKRSLATPGCESPS